MSDVDLFEDLDTDAASEAEATDSEPETDADAEEIGDAATGESEEKPVETVPSIPDGAVSVTEFAQYVTQELMKAKISAGEDLDGTEYTVPQAVYQTVKAQRDRIPHVLVRAENETEARVYILKDEALPWWMARREKLKDRGAGAKAASNRTPEENLTLLSAAVAKNLYALSRHTMWTERVDQTAKLVEKYRNFLSDANVNSDMVDLAVQEATDAFNAEQAAKAEEKAAKAKKSDKVEVSA